MLAGLLFATTDSTDRHDSLAATLPIGGVTLIEFQARLLIAAGASQIVVVVARLTPELLGAINRIGRRGIAVDAIRSPAEALAKLHPLARVVWLADGLVTTNAIVETLRDRDHDTVLVSQDDDELERIGPNAVWAGAATIDPQRIGDVARLPVDYDFASSLLRVTVQRGAEQLTLPDTAIREGHGIQRDSRALAAKGRAAMVAALGSRSNWVDRFLVAPLAKLVLPFLVARGVPAIALGSGGALFGLTGVVGVALGHAGPGMMAVVLALALIALADVLAWLRDQQALGRILHWLLPALVALTALSLGHAEGSTTAILLGVAAILAGTLAERAASGAHRRLWWAVPAAYPLILLPAAILDQPVSCLAAATVYAVVTLSAAIEQLRASANGKS